MGVKQVKVDVNDLMVGMFVSGLDRPWTQTPFPLQGFYVRDAEEIKQLKTHCRFVYIDAVRGIGPVAAHLRTVNREAAKREPRVSKSSKIKVDVAPLKIRRGVYQVGADLRTEMEFARRLLPAARLALTEIMRQAKELGSVPVAEVEQLAGRMVESMVRNPDALTWLSRVGSDDDFTFGHSLRAAVWALNFGRHIGLTHKDLNVLAMGVLLKDIGKTKINPELLQKSSRNAGEERLFEQFLDFSTEILRQSEGLEPRVISVVKNHCERVNGSGFPNQLRGDKVPLLARIAGIVTLYDETVYPSSENFPMSPSRAVAKLYEFRDREFQEELVVEFIRAIGLYPTGTLVELNSGEVAVVVEQNFERRLKPRIVIVMDAARNPVDPHRFVDLAEDDRNKQALVDSGKKRIDEVEKTEIVQDLDAAVMDIDIAGVRDEYLSVAQEPKKKRLFGFLRRGN